MNTDWTCGISSSAVRQRTCRWLLILTAACGAMASWPCHAREIYLNVQSGADTNPGTAKAPLATAQRAVALAQSGDVIHLGPEGAVIRQEIVLTNKDGLTIEGHGCTLTGADPLPQDNWEPVGPNLARRRMPQPPMQRHLLIVAGKANRMGRSPTVRPPFPEPGQLQPGQFCWEDIPDAAWKDGKRPKDAKGKPVVSKEGWLYVCGPRAGMEWSVRVAGVRTSARGRDLTIRNLNCRHALNDGFNIHGDWRGLRCTNITGYENFDEGFSAHEACECWIDDGRFWGNDNAVADVNLAETFYRRCEFRDSVSTEVLFHGGKHSLDDCQIVATGRNAFLASATTVGKDQTRVPIECRLSRCEFRSADDPPRGFVLNDADLQMNDCKLQKVQWDPTDSRVTIRQCTLDGKPLPSP